MAPRNLPREDTDTVKIDPGVFFRFFMDAETPMAVLDSRGRAAASNGPMETLLASLSLDLPSPITGLLKGEQEAAVFETPVQVRHGDAAQWVKIKAWRIKTPAGDSSGGGPFIGMIIEDQTLIRKEEKKLLSDKKIAEKAAEAKSRFLANMSHEIRTPIQTVIGMTELLEDTELDHEQAEYSRQVKFSAEVLLSLINDILDYSKIEAGKMELECTGFDLAELVEQAVEMITLEAHRKGLEIAVDISAGADIFVRGDPGKFRQIMINLAKNAVKFTRKGGVTVKVGLVREDGREMISAAVEDTGIGVSEEARSRLFTTFMQADASDTRRFGGTGLGLAISRNLVELMKGKIGMVPHEGGGSVFRFTVPLERAEGQKPPLPMAEGDRDIPILAVDDDAAARRVILSYLKDLGYQRAEGAASGGEALAMMRAAALDGKPFELCFLDMIMPVMDGWRLASEIHHDERIHQAALILLVPHGLMGKDTKMTLLKWFKAYINKPVKRRRLGEALKEVLSPAKDAGGLQELEALPEEEGAGGEPGGEKSRETEKAAPSGGKALILIAEDHPVNQKLFAIIMEKLGYSPVLAGDGLEALEKALARPVSLVFMDIQMPRMNGCEAAEKLREAGFDKPIIAVTASALEDEWERCRRSGMNDLLLKPFKREDIHGMIEKWLKKAEPPERPAAPAGGGEVPAAFVIPVEGAEIVPATKSRAELLGPAGGGTGAPVPPPAEAGKALKETVFSSAEVLDTFLGNEGMARSLLEHFLERTEGQIEGFPALPAAGDWETARREAHTIKGAALTLSGGNLGNAAARLEGACKNTDGPEAEAAYKAVQEAFARFRAAAEEFLTSREKKFRELRE